MSGYIRAKEWKRHGRGRGRDTAWRRRRRRRRWEETRRRGARTHKSRGWQRMTLRVVNLWITRAPHRTTVHYIPFSLNTAAANVNAGQSNMIITKKLHTVCVWGGIGSSKCGVWDRRAERHTTMVCAVYAAVWWRDKKRLVIYGLADRESRERTRHDIIIYANNGRSFGRGV